MSILSLLHFSTGVLGLDNRTELPNIELVPLEALTKTQVLLSSRVLTTTTLTLPHFRRVFDRLNQPPGEPFVRHITCAISDENHEMDDVKRVPQRFVPSSVHR